ncbi:hypothetical protein, partial [Escherichia coli]|uniref:hypothetical protein n=1 Tax=Escherichia coli TaxID=562 RepID=UPI001AA123CC
RAIDKIMEDMCLTPKEKLALATHFLGGMAREWWSWEESVSANWAGFRQNFMETFCSPKMRMEEQNQYAGGSRAVPGARGGQN